MAQVIQETDEQIYGGINPAVETLDSILGKTLMYVNPVIGAAYNVASAGAKGVKYLFDKNKAEDSDGQVKSFTSSQDINQFGGRERGTGTEFTTKEITTNNEVEKPWGDMAQNAVGAIGSTMMIEGAGGNSLSDKIGSIFGSKNTVPNVNNNIPDINTQIPYLPDNKSYGIMGGQSGSSVGESGKRTEGSIIDKFINGLGLNNNDNIFNTGGQYKW